MNEKRPSPAVYGIETEYSCMVTQPDDVVHEIVGSCHSEDAKIGLYLEPSMRGTASIDGDTISEALEKLGIYCNSSGMLSNGGRFYMDPSGPEYATPETSSAREAVLRSFEGDLILLDVFRYLQEKEVIKSFQVNRRIVDHNRSSRGVHLNTLTKLGRPAGYAEDKEPAPLVIEWFATLNAVKGAMFGSGGLLLDKEGKTAFHHSPRLSLTNELSAYYGSYKVRPLVRKPFKIDADNLARIETVTSDALNFAWPMRASLIATKALTGVIELGYGDRLPRMVNPVSDAQLIGRYGNKARIEIVRANRKSAVKPLDVLRQICEVVLAVDDIEHHLDKESDQVIGEIIDCADRMDQDIYSVANQVESVARQLAIEKKIEKSGKSIDSETLCRFDYAWDWLGGGIAEDFRNKRVAGWHGFSNIPSQAKMRRRFVRPPEDTRAKVRGDTIKELHGMDESEWAKIDFGVTAEIYHPLDTKVPQLPL